MVENRRKKTGKRKQAGKSKQREPKKSVNKAQNKKAKKTRINEKVLDKIDNKIYEEDLKAKSIHEKKDSFSLVKFYIVYLAVLFLMFIAFPGRATLILAAGFFLLSLIVFTIIELVDCVRKIFAEGEPMGKYIMWLVIILAFPIMGALFYWLTKR